MKSMGVFHGDSERWVHILENLQDGQGKKWNLLLYIYN